MTAFLLPYGAPRVSNRKESFFCDFVVTVQLGEIVHRNAAEFGVLTGMRTRMVLRVYCYQRLFDVRAGGRSEHLPRLSVFPIRHASRSGSIGATGNIGIIHDQ
jgi:hypothetical protein